MALYSSSAEWEFDEFEAARREVQSKLRESHRDTDFGEFVPGQPIGPRPAASVSPLRRGVTTVLCLGLGGWGGLQIAEPVRPWLTAAISYVKVELQRHQISVAAEKDGRPADLSDIATAAKPLSEAKIVADVPLSASPPPAPPPTETVPDNKVDAPVETGAIAVQPETQDPPAPASSEDNAPLPKPEADPTDPLQKRALAAGLHPQLSKVLLSSLSDDDFSNAKTAVRRALAEAKDTDKFVWPRDTKSKKAVFQIHFVPGAPEDCRRFVVTVMKNGWTTTARPMERCGVKLAVSNSK